MMALSTDPIIKTIWDDKIVIKMQYSNKNTIEKLKYNTFMNRQKILIDNSSIPKFVNL